MKGRRAPPPVIFALPRASDPSQAIDTAYFRAHPAIREYIRKYIPGETPAPMHPDTRVYVRLIGADRVRGFAPPPAERGLN